MVKVKLNFKLNFTDINGQFSVNAFGTAILERLQSFDLTLTKCPAEFDPTQPYTMAEPNNVHV